MTSDGVVVLRELIDSDPDSRKEYAFLVVGILRVKASELRLRGLGDAIVDRAFMALQKRLERELAGLLISDQPRYLDIPIDSADFKRIANRFVINAIRDLADQEARHHRQREDWEFFDCVVDHRNSNPSENEDETMSQLDQVYRICRPAELRCIKGLLASKGCKETAARELGVSVNYLDKVISRIRHRLENGDQ